MRRGRWRRALRLAMAIGLATSASAQPPAAPPRLEVERPTLDEPHGERASDAPVARETLRPREIPALVDRYRSDPDFQYESPDAEGPSFWERFWEWIDRTFWDPIRDSTTADGRQTFVVILAILALAWVVTRLLRVEGAGGLFVREGGASPSAAGWDVEDIAEVDLAGRLRRALADEDHREAVRVRYLAILQALDASGALAWRRDKTNRAYVEEVARSSPDLAGPFRQATRVFDAVWYGERPVSAARYARLAPLFDAATPSEATA